MRFTNGPQLIGSEKERTPMADGVAEELPSALRFLFIDPKLSVKEIIRG